MEPIFDVKFYVNERDTRFNPDIYCVFLEPIEGKPKDFMSYAHVGQHSECHIDYINESREATKEEYIKLYNELVNHFGYNLNVLNKE